MKNYNIQSKLEEYLAKYGDVNNLLADASSEEKDEFLVLRKVLEAGYESNPLGDQHALDIFQNITNYDSSAFIDDNHPLSINYRLSFSGSSNIFYPEGYFKDSFPDEITFSSINQFFQFHSALLFLNRKLAKQILSGEVDVFNSLEDHIENYDDRVWRLHRIKIMEEGAKSAFESSLVFKQGLMDVGDQFIKFHSSDEFWGGDMPSGNHNYWGKILTRLMFLEKQKNQ